MLTRTINKSNRYSSRNGQSLTQKENTWSFFFSEQNGIFCFFFFLAPKVEVWLLCFASILQNRGRDVYIIYKEIMFKKLRRTGEIEGWLINNDCYSWRGLKVGSKRPCWVTHKCPTPGDMVPSSGHRGQMHSYAHTHRQTYIHT